MAGGTGTAIGSNLSAGTLGLGINALDAKGVANKLMAMETANQDAANKDAAESKKKHNDLPV